MTKTLSPIAQDLYELQGRHQDLLQTHYDDIEKLRVMQISNDELRKNVEALSDMVVDMRCQRDRLQDILDVIELADRAKE